MPVISVRIPQLGEGLQEALLVQFLKQPGDAIDRDEPIYVMETDKATTDVESPYDGKLVQWTVKEGDVLEIGQEIAKMIVAEGTMEMPSGHQPSTPASAPVTTTDHNPVHSQANPQAPASSAESPLSAPQAKTIIPPRTRRYLKEKGMLDIAQQIPVSGTKLTPADVDRFVRLQQNENQASSGSAANIGDDIVTTNSVAGSHHDAPIPRAQQTLNYRMQRGAQACVPVTMMQEVDWTAIDEARKITRQRGGESGFVMLLWCVVKAMQNHSKFRSSLIGGKTLRTFEHVHLGVAVALPDDGLVTAVVKDADEMTREQFNLACLEKIELARQGTDQIDATTTLTISNIGMNQIRWGIPAIVSPAAATLAVGEVFEKPVPNRGITGNSFEFRRTIQLVLSFDHRIANGVGAAQFLNEICENLEKFQLNKGD